MVQIQGPVRLESGGGEHKADLAKKWEVLMVSSDPSSHQRLHLQAEERAIRQSISLAEHSGRVDISLDVLPAATVDDLAQRLLWKSSQGSSYDVIHFSGHCDVDNHLVRLIFSELHRQHGPDVARRFQSSSASVSGIHELAAQVSKHLEVQAMNFMDEIDSPGNAGSGNNNTGNSGPGPPGTPDKRKAMPPPAASRPVPTRGEDSVERYDEDEKEDGFLDMSNYETRERSRSCSDVPQLSPSTTSSGERGRTLTKRCEANEATGSLAEVVETSKARSLTPDFRMIRRSTTKIVLQADAEERVDERRLLVFTQATDGPTDPSLSPGPPSRPSTPDSTAMDVCSDHDPLVLRLPDGGPNCTKDIVLTKKQILEAGVGSLAFEMGGRPGMNFVSTKAFAEMMSPYALDLRCILLNACHSQLACEQLLGVGIPMAICAKGKMSDSSALHFSKGFYEALAYGKSIERAYLEGKHRMSVNDRRKAVHQRPGPPNTSAMTHYNHHPSRFGAGAAGASHHRPQSGSGLHPTHPHGVDPEHVDTVCLFRANGTMRLNPVSVRRHHDMDSENKSLRRMIQEGMRLLSTKDREIQDLRDALDKYQEREKKDTSRTKTKTTRLVSDQNVSPNRSSETNTRSATGATRRRETSGVRINTSRVAPRRTTSKSSKAGAPTSSTNKLRTNSTSSSGPKFSSSSREKKETSSRYLQPTFTHRARAEATLASTEQFKAAQESALRERVRESEKSSDETKWKAAGDGIAHSRRASRNRVFTSASTDTAASIATSTSAESRSTAKGNKDSQSPTSSSQAPQTPTKPRRVFTANAPAHSGPSFIDISAVSQQQQQQQQQHQHQVPSGFGSSVPRFASSAAGRNPGRYDCVSPKTRTTF